MAITSAVRTSVPTNHNTAVGSFFDNGTVKKSAFTLGFTPRYVKLINATDRTTLEWYEGMAADSAIKTVAAGTVTLETTGGITVGKLDTGAVGTWTVYSSTLGTAVDSSHLNAGGEVAEGFRVAAATVPASKQFYFYATE